MQERGKEGRDEKRMADRKRKTRTGGREEGDGEDK